ncbi:nucleotide-binding protein [Desulfurobacterium sp.]
MQVTVSSGKGGVGKSSITASLLYLLSKDIDLVAVDADADTPNLDILLNVKNWEGEELLSGERVAVIDGDRCNGCGLCARHCPYDCIDKEGKVYRVKEVLCEGCNVCSIVCPHDFVISFKETISGVVKWGKTDYDFKLVSSQLFPGRPNSGKLVFKAKKVAQSFNEDLMVVDAAAGIGCSVVASINGSDLVIVVVEPTKVSLSDAKRLIKVLDHFGLKRVGIINKFDVNPEFVPIAEEFLKEADADIIGYVPYDKNVINAILKGKPPVEVFPESSFSVAINEVYENLKDFI